MNHRRHSADPWRVYVNRVANHQHLQLTIINLAVQVVQFAEELCWQNKQKRSAIFKRKYEFGTIGTSTAFNRLIDA